MIFQKVLYLFLGYNLYEICRMQILHNTNSLNL